MALIDDIRASLATVTARDGTTPLTDAGVLSEIVIGDGAKIFFSLSIAATEALDNLKKIQGLVDKLGPLKVSRTESAEQQVSAAEFILEGLHAHKRIGRNEERVFKAGEKRQEPVREKSFEPEDRPYRQKRQFN